MRCRYLHEVKRWFWAIDVAVVVSFALVGTDVHTTSSQFGNIARIVSPFLLALLVAVIALTRWFDPLKVRTGFMIGLATVLLGVTLRNVVWADATPLVFVIVTSAWFIGLMAGWRLVRLGYTWLVAR